VIVPTLFPYTTLFRSEDTVFEAYMTHLFSSAERFVIIYSIDSEAQATVGYVRNRRFSPWVQQHIPEWALVEKIDNRFPWRGDLRSEEHTSELQSRSEL